MPYKACRDTARLGTCSNLALQGYPAVVHCKDTLRLGTAGILCGHCKHTQGGKTSRVPKHSQATASELLEDAAQCMEAAPFVSVASASALKTNKTFIASLW